MTGYGLAFPLNSKHKNKFNEMLLEYRENGDLERLSRYWLHGVCKPNMQEKRASEPLSIDQFLSAFLLLILGEFIIILIIIILIPAGTMCSLFLLLCEHLYVRYIREAVKTKAEGPRSQYYSATKKDSCFSALRNTLSSGSTDNLMIRSCSIPESLAAEWESQDRTRNSPIKPRYCRTDLCAAKYGRIRTELDEAQLVIKMLEEQLSDHGICLRYPDMRLEINMGFYHLFGAKLGILDYIVQASFKGY